MTTSGKAGGKAPAKDREKTAGKAIAKAGFVAVVGRPNVGKSTLVNRAVGRKVTIVAPRPQTTRHRILGICRHGDAEIAFVDTPGLNGRAARRAINRLMQRTAIAALADADLALFVTEAGRYTEDDGKVLAAIERAGRPVVAAMNKTDEVSPRERLLPLIAAMAGRAAFADIVPVSALRGENVERLLEVIAGHLPASPALFPDDAVTDRSDTFLAAEAIREKLTLRLRDELPYGVTVDVERFEREPAGLEIGAVIYVERESHKAIVIGKGGAALKAAGSAARRELARRFGAPVHLDLWVRVKENWADSERGLRALGYDPP